jgi:hypothetical protein
MRRTEQTLISASAAVRHVARRVNLRQFDHSCGDFG